MKTALVILIGFTLVFLAGMAAAVVLRVSSVAQERGLMDRP